MHAVDIRPRPGAYTVKSKMVGGRMVKFALDDFASDFVSRNHLM
jgi:hypothetical protein